MRAVFASILLIFAGVPGATLAQETPVRFATMDVYLQSAGPVAAWQFELDDVRGSTIVVGVERGDNSAFIRVPYYDRDAVTRGDAERIVVADYSLADEADLPSGRTHIATLHLMLTGEPEFNLQVTTATDYEGKYLQSSASFDLRSGSEQ